MTQPSPTDLIARLEGLSGPCRQADTDIVLALYPQASIGLYCEGDFEPTVFHAEPLVPNKRELPRFTESVDAALTLVPEGAAWWEVRKIQAADSPMRAFGPCGMFTAKVGMNWGDNGISGNHDSPAIALCIACLRARLGK